MVNKLDAASQKAGDGPINKQSLIMTLQGLLKGGARPAMAEAEEEEAMEDDVFDLTKHKSPEPTLGGDAENLGAAVVKPDGAPTTGVDVEVDGENKTVNISMNEGEAKLRKYIRNRLEEMAGTRKPTLNESVKSDKIKKLDSMIEEQVALFESMMEENLGQKLATGMGKAADWMSGNLAKQKKIKQQLPSLTTPEAIDTLFNEIFGPGMKAGVAMYAMRAEPEKKLEILQQAAEDEGLGKVAIQGQDIAYVPVGHAKAGGPSGFAMGRSRLGT